MIQHLQRHKWWALLAVLLLLNVIRYWPKKPAKTAFGPGQMPPPMGAAGAPGDGGGPDGMPFGAPSEAMRRRMEAMLKQLPADQRKAAEDRMKADKEFFDSLKDVPEDQRQAKIQQHFADNPPPPGIGPGGPGGGPGGPSGPGSFEPTHLPPPEARHSMDQHIANQQKQTSGS